MLLLYFERTIINARKLQSHNDMIEVGIYVPAWKFSNTTGLEENCLVRVGWYTISLSDDNLVPAVCRVKFSCVVSAKLRLSDNSSHRPFDFSIKDGFFFPMEDLVSS